MVAIEYSVHISTWESFIEHEARRNHFGNDGSFLAIDLNTHKSFALLNCVAIKRIVVFEAVAVLPVDGHFGAN